MQQNLAFWKDLGDIVESFATALAIILGGLWTYRAFIRQRLALPRLDVSLTVEQAPVGKSLLVRAQVLLRNSGNVIATSSRGEIRLRQVVPPPSDIEEAVATGLDPVPADCAQVEWPMLAGREWIWKPGEFEIEPGEADSLSADFFIPLQIQVVEIYFFLANARKKRQNIGWTVLNIHHLRKQEEPDGQERQRTEARGETAGTEAATKPAAAEAATASATRQGQKVVKRPASPPAR